MAGWGRYRLQGLTGAPRAASGRVTHGGKLSGVLQTITEFTSTHTIVR